MNGISKLATLAKLRNCLAGIDRWEARLAELRKTHFRRVAAPDAEAAFTLGVSTDAARVKAAIVAAIETIEAGGEVDPQPITDDLLGLFRATQARCAAVLNGLAEFVRRN